MCMIDAHKNSHRNERVDLQAINEMCTQLFSRIRALACQGKKAENTGQAKIMPIPSAGVQQLILIYTNWGPAHGRQCSWRVFIDSV